MRKAVFNGKYLYAFPQVDWNAATVKKNADPYLKVSVQSPEGMLWDRNSPSDLVERMKLVGDPWDCSGDNGHVQCHEKHCKTQGNDDHDQWKLGGIV